MPTRSRTGIRNITITKDTTRNELPPSSLRSLPPEGAFSDLRAAGRALMAQVVFVGAGPGSADLITLRGARVLARADVVLFDALTDPALRELAPQAQWLDVGKRGFSHATRQTAINALLVRMARQRPQPVDDRR